MNVSDFDFAELEQWELIGTDTSGKQLIIKGTPTRFGKIVPRCPEVTVKHREFDWLPKTGTRIPNNLDHEKTGITIFLPYAETFEVRAESPTKSVDRESLAKQLEDEIGPLIEQDLPDDEWEPREYNCCGCSTYREILDHAIRIVLGTEGNKE